MSFLYNCWSAVASSLPRRVPPSERPLSSSQAVAPMVLALRSISPLPNTLWPTTVYSWIRQVLSLAPTVDEAMSTASQNNASTVENAQLVDPTSTNTYRGVFVAITAGLGTQRICTPITAFEASTASQTMPDTYPVSPKQVYGHLDLSPTLLSVQGGYTRAGTKFLKDSDASHAPETALSACALSDSDPVDICQPNLPEHCASEEDDDLERLLCSLEQPNYHLRDLDELQWPTYDEHSAFGTGSRDLFGTGSFRATSPTPSELDVISLLDHSDASSSEPSENDYSDSDSDYPSSRTSTVASSVYSAYSKVDIHSVASCSSISWSRVRRSVKSSSYSHLSVEGCKDGNASGYVESSYALGYEPEEPEDLTHAGSVYLIRGERGRGSFGRVMMANDGKGRILAVKVVHKDKQYRSPDGREILISEKRILEKVAYMKRPFLTPLLDSWADNKNVYFVMPFYPKTLHTLMCERRVKPKEFKPYIAELVSGLASLHKAHIIHRDLKPENILIDAEGHLVIGDFGLATVVGEDEPDLDKCRLTGTVGTMGYMAPEVHYSDDVKTPSGQRSYGFKADIWSLAAVIVEMTLGQHQYFVDYSDGPPQFNWSRRIDYKNIRDMDLRDLIKSMLLIRPIRRPSAEGIKRHPYFSDVDFAAVDDGKWDEAFCRPTPPAFPHFGPDRWATIKFTSFHNGMDSSMSPSQCIVDDDHQLIPTPWVAKQRALDDEDPLVFEFITPSSHFSS